MTFNRIQNGLNNGLVCRFVLAHNSMHVSDNSFQHHIGGVNVLDLARSIQGYWEIHRNVFIYRSTENTPDILFHIGWYLLFLSLLCLP